MKSPLSEWHNSLLAAVSHFLFLTIFFVQDGNDFYQKGDCQEGAIRPTSLEKPTGSTTTISQLESLYQQLYLIAPSGVYCKGASCDVIGSINLAIKLHVRPSIHFFPSSLTFRPHVWSRVIQFAREYLWQHGWSHLACALDEQERSTGILQSIPENQSWAIKQSCKTLLHHTVLLQ